MEIPIQVTFREMEPSSALEEYVRKRAKKLETFCDRIVRCRVMVEAPHRHHQHGHIYHVRIDVTVPGNELVVNRNPENRHHTDIHACIDDAFDDAQRIVQDYARKHRGEVKRHAGDAGAKW